MRSTPIDSDGRRLDEERYQAMYEQSVADPEGFWGEHGKRLEWIKPYTKVKNTSFTPPFVSVRWFEDGTLNVSANCLDRHLAERGDQVAIIWEGDDPSEDARLTYREVHEAVCRLANALKARGVAKGDGWRLLVAFVLSGFATLALVVFLLDVLSLPIRM